MKPIYKPKGAAAEYGELAINIYTGCPHRCYYCFAPNVLRREREKFHSCVQPREGIVDAVKAQIERENITGQLVHLCFTCDPYPMGHDSAATREIIRLLKDSGNHVQILTKNGADAARDFDLLDKHDWFGITYAGYDGFDHVREYIPKEEPNAGSPHDRLLALAVAHQRGINTWISAEPVLKPSEVIDLMECADYVDLWKIGKLNYHPSDVDWKKFGEVAEATLQAKRKNYYIKESLRNEMESNHESTSTI